MYLLPRAHQLTYTEGTFTIQYTTEIMVGPTCGSNAVLYAKMIKEDVLTWVGMDIAIVKGQPSSNQIYLTVNNDLEALQYEVKINEEQILLVGGSEEALLYAVQTLRQIISQCVSVLPALHIVDSPEVETRGYYHDVTRGRVPTLQSLKELVDRMSYYKLNQLQLYVEHTYLFRGFSEVWRDETPLTAEEIMELDEYCAQRHIDLVPSLACFGHMYKVLSTKSFAEYCEFDGSDTEEFSYWGRMDHHTMQVAHEGSLSFVKKMILEFMQLFRSNKFNLCADETFDLGKGRSKALADEVGVKHLYIDFVKSLCEFLVEQGKIPMFWGDIICQFPELYGQLPDETICLTWGYAATQGDEQVKALAEAGAIQYVCPGVGGWNEWINLIPASYENITRMCRYGQTYGAIGVLNTDWGDFGHINQPEFSTTGMIYGAAFSWNSTPISFEDINREISVIEYHDVEETFVSAIAKAQGKCVFCWHDAVKYRDMNRRGYTAEESEKFFRQRDKTKANDCNEVLAQIDSMLRQSIKAMDSSKRAVATDYLLALEGMRVWNLVGATLLEVLYGEKNDSSKDAMEVASLLETWFMHYKAMWRKTSKEGDLRYTSEIVFWYADLLRGRKAI